MNNLKDQFESAFSCVMKYSQATGGYYYTLTSREGYVDGASISLVDDYFYIDCNGFLQSDSIDEVKTFIDNAEKRAITVEDMIHIYNFC